MSFITFVDEQPINFYLREELPRHGINVLQADVLRFADGEFSVDIRETVRGQTVFIVSSIFNPVNDNLMKILIMTDALKRASASKVCLVTPYLGYSRQDRKVKPRQPITASLVAKLLQVAGVDYVVTIDLHAMQIEGFYSVPLDNLSMVPVAARYLKDTGLFSNYIVVSPDHGGVVRARKFANILGADMAIIDKQRLRPNEVADMKIIGDVKGCDCIIVDDMVDTGGTLIKAASLLKENGATRVDVYCTHPVLSGMALNKLACSDAIDHFYFSDTTPRLMNVDVPNITIISCSNLICDAIIAINSNSSIADVIDKYTEGSR